MKIAVMAGKFPSLSETFILNQITGFIANGHTVDVYGRQPENIEKNHPDIEKYRILERTYLYPKVPSNYIYRLLKAVTILAFWGVRYPVKVLKAFDIFTFGKSIFSLRLLYQMVPLLEQKCPSYDVVHCHFGTVGIRAVNLKELGVLRGKVSVVFHGQDITEHIKVNGPNAYNKLFQKGDLFLPISNRWRKQLLELGCPEKKLIVHHMGIDSQRFKFLCRSSKTTETIHIASVARLIEKKGIEYGIRAVAQLKLSFPNIAYTVVGDGPLRPDLEQLIEELNVGDNVTLAGWKQQDEVIEILNRSVFFLAPSITTRNGDQEGIPVAIMEAMAMGLIVVSTLHSGIPELVTHQASGFLLPEKDTEGIVETLIHLINHPVLCEQIGVNARHRIEEEFDVKKLNYRLNRIFESLE